MAPNLEIRRRIGEQGAVAFGSARETVVIASCSEQEGSMTDTGDHTHNYERPRIEDRAEIGPTLIGNVISSNTDAAQSAAFTHI
jgi:hypothetical protein